MMSLIEDEQKEPKKAQRLSKLDLNRNDRSQARCKVASDLTPATSWGRIGGEIQ